MSTATAAESLVVMAAAALMVQRGNGAAVGVSGEVVGIVTTASRRSRATLPAHVEREP